MTYDPMEATNITERLSEFNMLWEAIFFYSITRRHVLYTDKKSLD
jgi:hypothetical protein